MSEPFLERLNRFTPDASGLDRDALLFAAGRVSARPHRGWMMLAALLASTQVLSLVLLVARPAPHAGGSSTPDALTIAPGALKPPATESEANPGIWSARHRLDESEPEDRPSDTLTLIDSGPPLRAFTPTPSLLSN